MTTNPQTNQEPTLILQDDQGNYYMVPMKHMQLNLVQPDQVQELKKQLQNISPTSATAPVDAFNITPPLTLGGKFNAVGIFDFVKDDRRKFVPPQVNRIPGLNRMSPPS